METNRQQLPFISIVVLSYNQQNFIADCIDSVLSQQYDGELEIIFCDDCSTDETFEIIQKKVASTPCPHHVITHKCPQNGKVAVCMNTAVALSSGDWIMRVDGDDILHPDRVRLSAAAILKHPGAIAVSGQLTAFSNTPPPVQNPPPDQLQYLVADKSQMASHKKPAGLQWWGGVMTMSRRIFTEFGELPPVCNVLDDTMFATRTLMLGQFVIILNATLLYYRRHGGNISSQTDANQHSGFFNILKQDKAARDYYRRGLPCHAPILGELQTYTASHPEAQSLLDFFRTYFDNMRRHALFWDKSWCQRIQDAHIQGGVLHKIPHALSVLCPLTYAFSIRIKQLFK